jgi:hypothetical protein
MPLGHVEIVVYDSHTLKGEVLSFDQPEHHAVGEGKVTVTRFSDVRSLPTAGHDYFHVSTTNRQNSIIEDAYASHSHDKYNLLDNNCRTTAQGALQEAGADTDLMDGPDPRIDADLDGVLRFIEKIEPSKIKPKPDGGDAGSVGQNDNAQSLTYDAQRV